VKLEVLEIGEGPPIVFLHGFPDHPPTAVPFFAGLARSGRRVIAPWLRGYAPSPRTGPYDLGTLAGDIAALIEPIGPVDLVGHDWGAAIAYAVCARSPALVQRAVTLALPHPATFLRRLRDPKQLRASWYMALFQLPGAGWIAPRIIDRLWRDWSPGFTLDAARKGALHACLAQSMPAPLGYYRAAFPPVRLGRIATPLLQLHGADDGCVLPPDDSDAHRFVERTLEIVPHAGHFLHLEDPAGIAARVTAWLTRRSATSARAP
jgi:pimeloyl-ACP methyl ester carboxylesterase